MYSQLKHIVLARRSVVGVHRGVRRRFRTARGWGAVPCMNRRLRIRGRRTDGWQKMRKSTNRQSPAGFRIRRPSPWGAGRGMLRSLMLFGLLVTMFPSSGMNSAQAQSPAGIKPLLRPPVAVRGSDLLIPLGPQGVGVRWPQTMKARIGGNMVATGTSIGGRGERVCGLGLSSDGPKRSE